MLCKTQRQVLSSGYSTPDLLLIHLFTERKYKDRHLITTSLIISHRLESGNWLFRMPLILLFAHGVLAQVQQYRLCNVHAVEHRLWCITVLLSTPGILTLAIDVQWNFGAILIAVIANQCMKSEVFCGYLIQGVQEYCDRESK